MRTGGGGLLYGGDSHSVRLHDLANIVVSKGHSRWCPAYVQSKQALLNTTEVTRQQCNVSFGWQPTNDLMSPPVDLWSKLQAMVYDILPSTTTGPENSANEQFFAGAKRNLVVSLFQTTQIKQRVSFIAAIKFTPAQIKQQSFESRRYSFSYPGWMRLLFTCVLWR